MEKNIPLFRLIFVPMLNSYGKEQSLWRAGFHKHDA